MDIIDFESEKSEDINNTSNPFGNNDNFNY